MAIQRENIVQVLTLCVGALHDLDSLVEPLWDLGRKHVHYGVQLHMFEAGGQALLLTLEQGLGDMWTQEAEEAWAKVYGFLSGVMCDGMKGINVPPGFDQSEQGESVSGSAASSKKLTPRGIEPVEAEVGSLPEPPHSTLSEPPLPSLAVDDAADVHSTASTGNSSNASSAGLDRMIDTLDSLSSHFSLDGFSLVGDSLQEGNRDQLMTKTMAALILADRLMVLTEFPTIVITPDCNIVLVSPAIEELLGFTPEELSGHNVNMIQQQGIATKHDAIVANYVQSCARRERRISSVVGETRPVVALHKNGSEVPVFLSVREIRGDRKGSLPILFVSQMRAAATEVNLRQALVEAKLLEKVFPFPYFEADEKGTIKRFNPAAEESFGMNANLVVGKNVVILMPDHITLIRSGRRERRSSHFRLVENYVQKIRDVGQESVRSFVIGKKTRHRAVRLNTHDEDSVKQEEFDIELEVTLSIGLGGEIKFRAFVRVQENFMNAEEFQDKLIEQMFPAPIAERYSKGINVNGTQDVSCLFVDIVGFTNMLAMTEDQATVEILNDIWQRFSAIQSQLPSFQPIKTNYDEMMVVVGMYDDTNHADDAVLGAFLMLEALAEHNQAFSNSIQIRIGISSGNAILAVMETAKLSFDVIGETTVLASRAESTGIANHVHVTENTYLRLSPRIKAKFAARPEPTYFKNIGEMTTYLSVTSDVRELLN
jgi:PAS domain S-box-containing protein